LTQKLFPLKSYLNYWLDAVDGHSLHSPFLFDFYVKIVNQKATDFDDWRRLRNPLSKDDRTIRVTDLGAGSAYMPESDRKISDILRYTTSSHKFASFYSRIIRHYKFKNVIELGTSVGINAAYLSRASHNVEITTFEGSSEIAEVARSLFRDNQISNIKIIEGNIDETVGPYLDNINHIDFALIDANHRFEPTVRYLELISKKIHRHSIIAIDDIHASPEMEQAWQTIQSHPRVQTTLDLYRCGLVLFNPSLTRQNVVLQF
jgi:predicted O-methyltransferase YrrM